MGRIRRRRIKRLEVAGRDAAMAHNQCWITATRQEPGGTERAMWEELAKAWMELSLGYYRDARRLRGVEKHGKR